jgi:predicted restriction endonuclease
LCLAVLNLLSAIDRLYHLNVGTTPVEEGSPHEPPHKPLLLLAVLDLLDEGKASPERIPWCQELRDRFTARFLLVRKHNDQNTPENPFYDHQCAACGLRIRLPAGNDVSFIDAAHLIPFAETRNDHPTYGLALCKNHHWAMDREIIAPGPDLHWLVSKRLDPRRSTGEKELYDLAGKSVLLPKDPAFHPITEGLNWRYERLSA